MIGRISRFMTRFVSRWLPDPLIFAMLLTLLTFVIALWLTPQTPISMVKMWGDGFWNLLAFGMQMALIIVTGHALASSAPVKSLLRTAASAAKTPVQGVMLVTFFGSVAVLIHEKYEKTGRTLDYSGFDGIRVGGACKPVEQILVVKP